MTSIRQSFLFSLEDDFGKGKGNGFKWIAPPPGSYIDSTHTRNTTRVQSAGTKVWDTFAYGKLEGSWNWHFIFDYNYLEPLYLVFEGAELTTDPGSKSIEGTTSYTYEFSKEDAKRVRSFCIRRVVLNRMAGGLRSSPGGLDSIVTLKGCVCTSVTFSRAAGQSQIMVTMNGFYATESMELGTWDKTDYQPYAGNLSEYTCLFINDGDGEPLAEDNYVANTETLTIKIDNSAEAIYNVCTPFAKEYYEGISKYAFSTTAYANDPSHYQQRVYSGGVDNTATTPWSKDLAPVNEMYILSYDTEIDDTHTTHQAAYEASPRSLKIAIDKCVIKSLQWKAGDSEKLQDNISSADCKKITMTVQTPVKDFSFTASDRNAVADDQLADYVAPVGP